MRNRQRLNVNGDGAAVVTYSRKPPTRRRARVPSARAEPDAEPFMAACDVPMIEAPETSVVPEVHAVAADRPRRDAAMPSDFYADARPPRLLRIVLFLGVLAIVGGIAVLAVAYNSAVNAPLQQTTAVDAAATADNVPADSASGGVAVRDVPLAPGAPPPASRAIPATAPETASVAPVVDDAPAPVAAAPAADDGAAPTTVPTPRPRPQGQPAQAAQSDGEASPPPPSDMDRLMQEVDRILASIPPSVESVPQPQAPLAAPMVAEPAPLAEPAATPTGGLSTVAPAAGSLASMPAPSQTSGGGPVPPADIPGVAPLSRLR